MTEIDAAAESYRCPTPCDPDCELNRWSCHEHHGEPGRQDHDPQACEARTAIANLSWLFGSGWLTQLGSSNVPEGYPPMFFATLRKPLDSRVSVTVNGSSVAEAAGKAAEWARGEADAAPKAAPPCRGFRWIGQSFATCDGCGKPAWEHEGELRLREGAKLIFGGGDDDWEVIPWKPGEAEEIKRKWAR